MVKNVAELERILRNASDAYYSGSDTILSDQEFDQLRDELEELDPDNPFLADVGAPVNSLNKVKHSIPMGSLNKANKQKEIDTWLNKLPQGTKVVVQEKLDGVSIELIYRGGKFVQAISRGDGIEGEDITHTIKNAQHFPRKISEQENVSVRCECLLHLDMWKKHFGETKNPRNTASGLVRRSDTTGSDYLSCTAFDVSIDGAFFSFEEHHVKWLKQEGFVTVPTEIVDTANVAAAIKRIEDRRDNLPYEIDGAVLKVNDVADQEILGEHEGRPKWAIAWKFAPMGGFTVLEDVIWTIGTRGTITPVAKVAPVFVGGVSITGPTLHNFSKFSELGAFIGDTVEVIRAGDVIPQVVRVVAKGKKRIPAMITECPACKGEIKIDGKFLKCANPERCGGVNIKRIRKWIEKRNIMYLGKSNVEALVESGFLNTIADLYRIPESNLAAVIGKGNAKRVMKEIDKSRTCPLHELMGSLSLDMLGRSESENLIELGIDTLDKWKDLTYEQILAFPGYQETKAKRISVSVRENWELVEEVARLLTVEKGKTTGNSFCFTGTMATPRKKLEQMVVDAGGQVRSVSKELTYLVIADPNSTSAKAKKARRLGISLISEKDFLQMV